MKENKQTNQPENRATATTNPPTQTALGADGTAQRVTHLPASHSMCAPSHTHAHTVINEI